MRNNYASITSEASIITLETTPYHERNIKSIISLPILEPKIRNFISLPILEQKIRNFISLPMQTPETTPNVWNIRHFIPLYMHTPDIIEKYENNWIFSRQYWRSLKIRQKWLRFPIMFSKEVYYLFKILIKIFFSSKQPKHRTYYFSMIKISIKEDWAIPTSWGCQPQQILDSTILPQQMMTLQPDSAKAMSSMGRISVKQTLEFFLIHGYSWLIHEFLQI